MPFASTCSMQVGNSQRKRCRPDFDVERKQSVGKSCGQLDPQLHWRGPARLDCDGPSNEQTRLGQWRGLPRMQGSPLPEQKLALCRPLS